MKTEYVIFGKAPNSEHEELLVCEKAGLKSKEHAERVCNVLENEHGCTETRVFAFDWSKPDFGKAVMA